VIKRILILVSVLAMLFTAACTPPPQPEPDQTYCQDIEDVQNAVQQYAEVDRVSVTNEVMDDLNEMGANERCPGYQHNEQEKE